MSIAWMITSLLLAVPLAAEPPDADAAVRRVVADYVGLYRRDTLPRWRELFLPSFASAHLADDGTVRQRTLAEFYGAQERYFASGKSIREDLENVRIERAGPLASVWADFVLTEDGVKSRGKLVLLLMAGRDGYRIHSLMFHYD